MRNIFITAISLPDNWDEILRGSLLDLEDPPYHISHR